MLGQNIHWPDSRRETEGLGALLHRIVKTADTVSEQEISDFSSKLSQDWQTEFNTFTKKERQMITTLFGLGFPEYGIINEPIDPDHFRILGYVRDQLTVLFMMMPSRGNQFVLWRDNK